MKSEDEDDSASYPMDFDDDAVQTYYQSAKGKGIDRGSWKHGQSVSSAYWDPSGRRVVSTSYDDTLRCALSPALRRQTLHAQILCTVWDFNPSVFSQAKEFPSLRPIHERNHDCQTVSFQTGWAIRGQLISTCTYRAGG